MKPLGPGCLPPSRRSTAWSCSTRTRRSASSPRFNRTSWSRVRTTPARRSWVATWSRRGAVASSASRWSADSRVLPSWSVFVARPDGRVPDQLRPLTLERGAIPYAEGSCLIRMGGTLVHCTASVEPGVPGFKKGTGEGWVTAEYAMLPRATLERTSRERNGPGGRTQEIQRLIGRSLRAAMATMAFGEFTIRIDCDVLQADGGTRTAAITGGCVALVDACAWLAERTAQPSPFGQLV